jgi:hypothetical protein
VVENGNTVAPLRDTSSWRGTFSIKGKENFAFQSILEMRGWQDV